MCVSATFNAAAQVLYAEVEPTSDMRASAAYRCQLLVQLLRRCLDALQEGTGLGVRCRPHCCWTRHWCQKQVAPLDFP